jgi:uncharacterized membrane protein
MKEEPRWHARLAVLAALALYVGLPPKLTFGPIWVAPVLVLLPLGALTFTKPMGLHGSKLQRALAIALIAILSFFNVVSVVLLVVDLLVGQAAHRQVTALDLMRTGAQIWVSNILVFGLWFWELDNDGPVSRDGCPSAGAFDAPDFLFPQMSLDRSRVPEIDEHWKPNFIDYLYVSSTNALAFSPTDTMPLSRAAKLLMLIESLVSFVTIALILARSVNILAG